MEVVLPRVADAAVDLQTILGDLIGHVADVGGDHRGDLAGIVGPVLHGAGDADGSRLAGLQVHRIVGHDVLERLERADRPAEGDPVLGVLHGHREQRVDRPDRFGDHQRERDLQLPFERIVRAENVRPGSVPAGHSRRAPPATVTDSKSTWARRRERSRHSSGVTVMPDRRRRYEELHGRSVEFRDHEQRVGGGRVLHEPAPSAELEALVGTGCLQAGAAVPVAVTGGERPCRDVLAGHDRRQHLPLRLRTLGGDRCGDDVHRDERSGLHEAADLLGDQRGVDQPVAADAAAAVGLRHQHREPAQLGRLLQPAAVESGRVVVQRPGAFEREFGLDEADGRLVEERLVVVERQFHAGNTVASILVTVRIRSEVAESVILTDVIDRIGTITLNRPARHNALNPELIGALDTAVRQMADDDAVKVVILTGTAPEGRARRLLRRRRHEGERRDPW